MLKNILITGGTGLIGTRLIEYLGKDKYNFRVLSRSKSGLHSKVEYFYWNPVDEEIDPLALRNIDVIINLAGASVADKRWSEPRKAQIIESRVKSIRTLTKYITELKIQPELMIGASAVGYYGDRGTEKLSESDMPGDGFLSEVCQLWEKEYSGLKAQCKRNIILRIGIVLSTKGGALEEMLKPAKAGIYGYFGSGKAIYPWIHIDDICEIIFQALKSEEYSGVVNASAPNPVDVKTLSRALKKARNQLGLNLSIPKFVLKVLLGEMSSMLTDSTYAIPGRLKDLRHQFLFNNVEDAIKNLLEKKI